MKLPTLKHLAKASATIKLAEGTNENGDLNVVKELENVAVRLEQSSAVVYTNEGKKVTLKAKIFLFEKLEEIPDEAHGFCIINGIQYDIANTKKLLNPDSSVHHIVLELI